MSEQAQEKEIKARMLKHGTQKTIGSLGRTKNEAETQRMAKTKRALWLRPAHGEVAADAVDGLPLHYRLGLAQRQQHSTLKGVSSWHIGACTHKNETKQKVIRISTVCRLRGNLPSASAAQ
jgi:hypothetical protein